MSDAFKRTRRLKPAVFTVNKQTRPDEYRDEFVLLLFFRFRRLERLFVQTIFTTTGNQGFSFSIAISGVTDTGFIRLITTISRTYVMSHKRLNYLQYLMLDIIRTSVESVKDLISSTKLQIPNNI